MQFFKGIRRLMLEGFNHHGLYTNQNRLLILWLQGIY